VIICDSGPSLVVLNQSGGLLAGRRTDSTEGTSAEKVILEGVAESRPAFI